MGFFQALITERVSKTFAAEAESVVHLCRSYGPAERSELKVCMLLAFASFAAEAEKTGDNTIFKIREAMESSQPRSLLDMGLLSRYTSKLIAAQKQAHATPNYISSMMAAGIPIWIVSIRALSHESVLPHARQLWEILHNSDSLAVYAHVNAIARMLDTEPMVDTLLRMRSTFSTPKMYKPS